MGSCGLKFRESDLKVMGSSFGTGRNVGGGSE